MPIFRLTRALAFPPVHYAEPDGLLAVGGDLSPERLLLAYRQGIFPWYSPQEPILWWSPDPRLVLFPEEVRISKSLKRLLRKQVFQVTADEDFREVVVQCAAVRVESGEGTWIVPEMLDAYCRLHEIGYAHSIESRCDGELVGGLYGVALGKVFFGESMFMRKTDASKAAFAHLTARLHAWGYDIVDCQVATPHLMSLGAREISRKAFLAILAGAVRAGGHPGSWKDAFQKCSPIF